MSGEDHNLFFILMKNGKHNIEQKSLHWQVHTNSSYGVLGGYE